MRLASLTCLLALGCATPAAPRPAAPEPAVPECGRYGYAGLYIAVSRLNGTSAAPAYDAAQAAAERDIKAADLATAAHDDRAAAGHYLACAQRYRDVPDDDRLVATARTNAMICYKNVRWAHANAGLWASEGRALLATAAQKDPRHADELERLIRDPISECGR